MTENPYQSPRTARLPPPPFWSRPRVWYGLVFIVMCLGIAYSELLGPKRSFPLRWSTIAVFALAMIAAFVAQARREER